MVTCSGWWNSNRPSFAITRSNWSAWAASWSIAKNAWRCRIWLIQPISTDIIIVTWSPSSVDGISRRNSSCTISCTTG